MSDKRRCKGVMKNPKHPEQGRQCKRWAANGTDYCTVHGGSSELSGWANPENLKNRCIARSSRTGSQCKKPALRGMRVCRFHGGATRASKEKARELLDRMVEPVLWELRDIALNPKTSDSDKLRAIHMVLDRAAPKESLVEVEVKPWEVTMQHVFKESTGISRAVPEELLAQVEADAQAIARERYEDITDAELVEEDGDHEPDWPDNVTFVEPPHPEDRTGRASVVPRKSGSLLPPKPRRDWLDE